MSGQYLTMRHPPGIQGGVLPPSQQAFGRRAPALDNRMLHFQVRFSQKEG